ncbi:MAG: SRPBCC family protein [Hyphomonadaceae bacterium]|nr:SRPBCC family protein [Hyphomonadaceae bacterium]
MTKRATTHATFVIERTLKHPPAKVFAAYADLTQKAKWFGGPPEWTRSTHTLDFRVGGRESESGGPHDGPEHTMNALYWDIVQNERIVMSYEMLLGPTRISVSLGTTEFKPAPEGTTLTYTEQGVFLDGFDDAGGRERGTHELLDQLVACLNS